MTSRHTCIQAVLGMALLMARNNELFGMAKSGGKLILSLFGSITQKTTSI